MKNVHLIIQEIGREKTAVFFSTILTKSILLPQQNKEHLVCKKTLVFCFGFRICFRILNGYRRSSATIFRVDVNIYVLFIAKRVWVHYRELICFSKNLSLEQIEIFQFCLKIRHLWRLPHPWLGGWVVGWMGGLIGGVR